MHLDLSFDRRMRRIAWAVIAAAVVSLITACGRSNQPDSPTRSAASGAEKVNCRTDVAEWTEGVRLFSGKEVVVWRRAVACKGGFPNASRGRDLEFELKYEPAGAHWKAPSGLKPKSFEIIDGVPHLGLYDMTGAQCKDQPPDKPLLKMVKWAGGQWVDIPLAQAPLDRALLNLHNDYWGHTAKGDAKGFIGADAKETGWGLKMTLRAYFAMGVHQCGLYQERIENGPTPKRAASSGASQSK